VKHLDLFSGIGGFTLAAQRVWGDDHEVVAFCEKNEFCQKVLKKHWPDVPCVEDIRDVGQQVIANTNSERRSKDEADPLRTGGPTRLGVEIGDQSGGSGSEIDILTGGFPCQPFSAAGKRDGRSDDRHLWPQMLRVIQLFRPRYVVAENVRGLLSIEDGVVFEQVCTDLECAGYEVQPFVIPAVAVDAHHRRDRIWFVAHNDNYRSRSSTRPAQQTEGAKARGPHMADAGGKGLQEPIRAGIGELCGQAGPFSGSQSSGGMPTEGRCWPTEPAICRVAHGVPNRVDRLKSLGNAIVPQVAEQIFRAIKECDK